MKTGITPVNYTIVVLEYWGGGWSGVDLVGDGELEGMVLGGTGVHRDSERV